MFMCCKHPETRNILFSKWSAWDTENNHRYRELGALENILHLDENVQKLAKICINQAKTGHFQEQSKPNLSLELAKPPDFDGIWRF